MKSTRLTSRYAKSLLNLSIKQNCLDKTLEDMNHIKDICSKNKDLVLLLKSPVVKTDKKRLILSNIFSKSVSEITMSFVVIITNKKREMYLQGIAESFISLYKNYSNIETVTITTPHPLEEKTKIEVLDFVKKNGKKNIEMKELINEELIGGMIIKIGDKELDASILRNIKNLKKSFNKNLYVQDF
tara:strand:- start:36 stop:593 length:558 start_codon:yes stop_codon:yes gene_type:complete